METFERLVQKYFPNRHLMRAWTLTGGISAEMTALAIANPDGIPETWIVRRPRGQASRQKSRSIEEEFRLLEFLHAQGLATPAPYALDLTGEILPEPYLVMAYIEGQPDFTPADPVGYARQMAAELSRIHALEPARAGLSFLPEFTAGTAIPPRSAQITPALEDDRIRVVLSAAWPFPRHNTPALLHGDYWPGNILWLAGRLAGVIDWEDFAVGDPLADLAISRLDLLWIYGREAMEAFTQHYLAATALDIRNLPYWDLYAALRLSRLVGDDLSGWAAFFAPYGRADITEQSIREYYRFFVQHALRQIE